MDKDQLKLSKRTSEVDFNKIVKKLQSDEQDDREKKFNRIRAKVLCVARFNLI